MSLEITDQFRLLNVLQISLFIVLVIIREKMYLFYSFLIFGFITTFFGIIWLFSSRKNLCMYHGLHTVATSVLYSGILIFHSDDSTVVMFIGGLLIINLFIMFLIFRDRNEINRIGEVSVYTEDYVLTDDYGTFTPQSFAPQSFTPQSFTPQSFSPQRYVTRNCAECGLICQENMTIVLECGDTFHPYCLYSKILWGNSAKACPTCPTCHRNINLNH